MPRYAITCEVEDVEFHHVTYTLKAEIELPEGADPDEHVRSMDRSDWTELNPDYTERHTEYSDDDTLGEPTNPTVATLD